MNTAVKKTTIGGQALIEGLMMRGPDLTAMGVRAPDGQITMETWATSPGAKPWYKKAPVIRGVFNMIDSQVLGFKCLMKSADLAGMEEEEPSRFEKWLAKTFHADLSVIVSTVAVVMGVVLALLLFMVAPTGLSSLLRPVVGSSMALSFIEGGIKLSLFILYLWATSRMKEMRRVYEYHGAEHKTIACYEAGKPLTVENIRGFTRFHPRCGTSFLVLVLLISILLFSVVTWTNPLVRVLLKLALLPLVVGLSYEVIRLAGRYNNPLTRIVSAPGLWIQRLTTREPDDDQLEVAIAVMKLVIPQDKDADIW